ncbi:MAG: hypothetical protein ACLVJX_11110 [Merdibacter sp.]
MEVQDNMKERLLTMCQGWRGARAQVKKRTLQLSEMLGIWLPHNIDRERFMDNS